MARQTFIIEHWYGAKTYREASCTATFEKKDVIGSDFNRVACKRKQTALRYLANWRRQAKEEDLQWLYPTLCRDDAHYQIVATPDGYHETEVVASGMMKDLDNAA